MFPGAPLLACASPTLSFVSRG
ncbi:hypothetical protein VARIO8X_70062 [Burkholderiales bacterium 8X]|nr:hypothetical protein VARIO8X_70062 [Burkholderiales bacterium 8X]